MVDEKKTGSKNKIIEKSKSQEGGDEHYRKLAEGFDADVSEQAKLIMEKELFEEIGRISSELAHDLRGPLQTIINCTYLLEKDITEKELLIQINEAVRYASSLLDSFRDYYMGHEISRTATSLDQIVERVLNDATIPPNVETNVALDPKIGRVQIDPAKIRRTLYNLVKNAVEAMPGGGELTVEAEDDGDMFLIRVRDTGVGIPEDIRDTLFKPFGSKKPGGSGLGLPSCWRVVVAHGGEITFESEVGGGTTFTVVLPKKAET